MTICAPYVDTTLWPPFDTDAYSTKTGINHYLLAFIVSGPSGEPSWGGYHNMETAWFKDKIDSVRARGGDVIVSFGGASGQELAQTTTNLPELVAKYQKVIDTYHLKIIDFDVEGGAVADKVSIDRRNKAIVELTKKNPGLEIWYTLPVMPDGLDNNGRGLLANAKANGVELGCVNVMAMDYGPAIDDMGAAAISAGERTIEQLDAIGYTAVSVGITPMIGVNDIQSEIFHLKNAVALYKHSQTNPRVCILSMWSANRDIAQSTPDANASAIHSSVVQSEGQFGKLLSGMSTDVSVPISVVIPGKFRGEWRSGNTYSVSDTVTYNGTTFICLNPHTSIPTYSPSLAESLWKSVTAVEPPIEELKRWEIQIDFEGYVAVRTVVKQIKN